MSPDYKLCIDILKMCIFQVLCFKKFGIIFGNLCIEYTSFLEWFAQALNLKTYLLCKYSQLPLVGLKPITYQWTVYCTLYRDTIHYILCH